MINMESIKGGLIGFIVGDALGVPIEFIERNKLKAKPVNEMLEYGTHNVPIGTWSDDTSMTIATLDSLLEVGEIDYDDIMKKFAEWYGQSKYTATGILFDIGISTQQALYNYMNYGIEPTKCGGTSYNSNGNGSLMRMLPIVYYLYNKEANRDEIVNVV